MTTASVTALLALVRPAIRDLAPYAHAHWNPALERLHANESPWSPAGQTPTLQLNRYPEPQPEALLQALATHYDVTPEQLLLGRGSDEAIDLLTRVFCEAGRDAVTVCPPTFGMYAVAARIQGARVLEAPLRADFSLDVQAVQRSLDHGSRIIWLCSPNNPTGNLLAAEQIETVLRQAAGRALVVIDEAYGEFTAGSAWCQRVATDPGIAILRTLSKAHGLAGIRLGTLIAHPALIGIVRKITPPYAVPQPTVAAALQALTPPALTITAERVSCLIGERERLAKALLRSPWVTRVWPSAANFLMIATDDPDAVLQRAENAGLLLRNFSGRDGLGGAIRISVGTPEQNTRLLRALEVSNP